MNRIVFFVSMMRSGHHAVLNWFARNQLHPVRHFNDCRVSGGELRGDIPDLMVVYHGASLTYCVRGLDEDRRALVDEYQACRELEAGIEIAATDDGWDDLDFGTTIYSFEERGVDSLHRAITIAKPDHIITVVRDPLNFLASSLGHARRFPAARSRLIDDMEQRMRVWRDHASQLRQAPDDARSAINFNFWFSNRAYRDRLAARYGFKNNEIGVDEVMLFGKGSSFDGMRYEAAAGRMDVLNRWRSFHTDEEFLAFLDADTIQLARELFDQAYEM